MYNARVMFARQATLRLGMSQEQLKSTFIRQLLRFLKIFLHTFLYVKRVYPQETFQRVKIFGTFAWYSKSNVLQEYVQQILHSLYHMIYEEKLRLIVIELFHELNQNSTVIYTSGAVMQKKCNKIASEVVNIYETNNDQFIHDSKSFLLLQFDHSFCKGNSIFRTILNHYCINQNNFFRKQYALNEDSSYNNQESIEKHMYHCFLSEDSEFVTSFRAAINSLLEQQTFDMDTTRKMPLSFNIAIQGTDDFISDVGSNINACDVQNSKLVESLMMSHWTLLSNEILNKDQRPQTNKPKKQNKTLEEEKEQPVCYPDNWTQDVVITLRGGGFLENIGIPFFHISLFNMLDSKIS